MMIVSVLAGVLFVTMAVNASTTISTNVSTGGTLDVTGLTTLANASTTRISLTSNLMVNGMATTTGSTGAIATQGNLTVLGTASTSALMVGDEPQASTINGLVFGTCTAPTVSIATTTGYLVCSTATGLQAGDTVFVQATSSFPGNFVVQAASSTVAGVISIRILNVATTSFRVADSTDATGPNTLNFWAVR